jgi:TolA-binding protein
MNNIEKIFELLEKKNLSEQERFQLNSLIESDPEVKKIYETYMKLGTLLKSKHISLDELRDYILYKNNIDPENKDIIKRIPEIELHLKNCEKCTNEFKSLNEEYSELDLFLADKLATQPAKGIEEVPVSIAQLRFRRASLYAFASVIVIGFVYLSLLLISNMTTPDSYQLASVSDKSEYYVTRGRATDEFQESLKALEENNFDKAIEFLQSDINKNPEDETIFYSHYILGLAYLEKADNSFIGLFRSFKRENAEKGLKNLQLCIEKNSSGKFPDITYNAYFYSAKASMMLGDNESAKKYLKIVVEEKGSKMSEAQSILNELE